MIEPQLTMMNLGIDTVFSVQDPKDPGSVLIVDDNPNNLRVLSGILQQSGYHVRPALSGPLALRAVQASRPDVILLDVRMPDMDGYEVCRQLKSKSESEDIPVIFISALHDTDAKMQAFLAGGVDYIAKPFQSEEVLARVRTHLGLAQVRRALHRANIELEERVRERTRDLEVSYQRIQRAMAEEHVVGQLLDLALRGLAVEDYLREVSRILAQAETPPGSGYVHGIFLAETQDGRSELRLLGHHNLSAEQMRSCQLLPFGDSACGRAAQEQQLVRCGGPCGQQCAQSSEGADRFCIPILSSGSTLGVLMMHIPAYTADQQDLQRFLLLLLRMADILSMAIERRRADERAEYLAYHDQLTQLANRRLFADHLKIELARCQRNGVIGAILLIDLDRFKRVNDALGHSVGDSLLKELAKRAQTVIRQHDTLARAGGDEFLVLLPELSTQYEEAARRARVIAEHLREVLSPPVRVNGHELRASASIGITLIPNDGTEIENLLARADTAMYQAKAAGGDAIHFYEQGLHTSLNRLFIIEKDMRNALQREEFRVFFQPQVDGTGQLVGVEALLRWDHPEQGLVSPAEFIPVAEESGLIIPLGAWVLRESLMTLGRWLAAHSWIGGAAEVSVNVSARQLRQPEFAEQVEEVLAASGVPGRHLVLEVTESVLVQDIEETIEKMARIRALGVRFSVDDFGTGYSSLAYLKRLPIDQLKIDQSFVRNVHLDSQDAAIVSSIIALANNLGLDVIAEGVETREELDFLLASGCGIFQGYLFGKPALAAEVEARFLKATCTPER